ncbi:MAG: hypothetical protein IV097_14005 [Burkholderiaceae bacterium]|nr:hypothetical protein [Burkholderiaceae bacterium]
MQIPHLMRQTWAAFMLLLLMVASAAAQRGGDDGEYQILQARYGTANRNIDVTQRLKELASQDQTFRIDNNTFGTDPDYGHVKTLRIFARGKNGQTRTFEYGEGSYVDGNQFTGWRGGNWGHGGWAGGWGDGPGRPGGGQQGNAGDDGEYQILQARYGTANRNIDVTQQLKELASQDRRFRMGNDSFGTDPDPGHVKTLRIFARGKNGQNRTFEYTEGSYVDGNQFTGWGGGNWGHGGWSGGWGGGSNSGGSGYGGLEILSASYGTGGRSIDVTARLRSLVRNDRLEVKVDNRMAGSDPAPNRPKSLSVSYSVGGRSYQTRIDENDHLRIP